MNMDKLNKFITFCDSQPKAGYIDHRMWSTCAVGDYARALGVAEPGWTTEAKSLTGMSDALTKLVGNMDNDGINTYGEFTQFLKILYKPCKVYIRSKSALY